MRKSKQETAKTRRRILGAASAAFRSHGVSGTGLADLMAAAGLTHGGFYKHFGSKAQVVEESVALASREIADEVEAKLLNAPGRRGLRAAIDDYLSPEHRDNAAKGCPFVALGSEIGRGGDGVRQAMTDGFERAADAMAKQLSGVTPVSAKKEALVMLCTMIGAVTMARVVVDPALSASILRQARKHLAHTIDCDVGPRQ